MVDFEHARKAMVDGQVRPSSITDRRLLQAMGEVPREMFVPESRRGLAYIEETHPFGDGPMSRMLAAPAPFAKLVQLAAIEPEDHVLDLGCGTGYSTAVIARLARTVVGLEGDSKLIEKARANLSELGVSNAEVLAGDLEDGAPGSGPYDAIVIEGALELVPEAIFAQLRDGGRLVAMLQRGAVAVAHLYVKSGKDVAGRAEFNSSLPPLMPAKRPDEFVF